ncbi:MAG: hypothetical protein H6577_21195 [Lewinellaceae bacterium]|nr:hypothetical protein [Lewinellaceae bacterium]
MKTIYTAIISTFLLLPGWSLLSAQVEPVLSLVTSLNINGVSTLQFDGDTQLEVQYWNNEYLQIEIIVDDPHFTKAQLKSLIPLGFFRLEHEQSGGQFVLKMPGLERKLTINGQEVNSFVKLRLTAPRNLTIDKPLNPWQ